MSRKRNNRSLRITLFAVLFLFMYLCIFVGGTSTVCQAARDSCGPNSANEYGASEDIPGDPDGLKGWLIHRQVSDSGDTLEIWCIEIAGGVGNSFGYRHKPAGSDKWYWIARCAFVGGQNEFGKEPTGDINTNGVPDGWVKVDWTSEDDGGGGASDPKDDDKTPGKKDWDWEYNPATRNLKRWETLDGQRVRPDEPDYDGEAPESFGDLFPPPPGNPDQEDDGKGKPHVKVKLSSHVDDEYNYELIGDTLTEYSPTLVLLYDKWSIAVEGVYYAAAPPFWMVDYDSSYVTWTYFSPDTLNLSTSGPISGFRLYSSVEEDSVYWLSDSYDDTLANFGNAGKAAGPARASGSSIEDYGNDGRRLPRLHGRPNPFGRGITVVFQLHDNAHLRLEVYDVRGQLVRTLADEALEAGLHEMFWDGTDELGAPLCAGIYFVRLTSDGSTDVLKVNLMR